MSMVKVKEFFHINAFRDNYRFDRRNIVLAIFNMFYEDKKQVEVLQTEEVVFEDKQITNINNQVTSKLKIEKVEGDQLKGMHISEKTAQKLMDDLYELGLRPSQEGSQGEKECIVKHLNDMRKIVGKKLEVEL